MNVFLYNGNFTLRSAKTGETRTFTIRTGSKGRRCLSVGSTMFAFVDDTGIDVFDKRRSKYFLDLALMLERLNHHIYQGNVELLRETLRCRKCNMPAVGQCRHCNGTERPAPDDGPSGAYVSPYTGIRYTGD